MSDIYLVDDHAMMRDGLRAVLEDAGHRVVGESDQPTQALADLGRLQPTVLLLDLQLGERSGFELLEQLSKRKLSTRTIVLTMSAQPRHVAEAMRLGAYGYVLKGSSSSHLLAAVQEVRMGQRYLGPGVKELADRALAAYSAKESELGPELAFHCLLVPLPLKHRYQLVLVLLPSQRMIDFGHRRIALLNGPAEYTFAKLRQEGYLRALQQAELKVDERLILQGHLSETGGFSMAQQLLALPGEGNAAFKLLQRLIQR